MRRQKHRTAICFIWKYYNGKEAIIHNIRQHTIFPLNDNALQTSEFMEHPD